jgi:anti-sigma factor RsiW
MNRSRLRKWIPLYAGGDLSARKARRLEKHLEKCADCRTEVEELKSALAGVRDVAGREALDWPEADWKHLMARVLSAKPEPRRAGRAATFPRKAWAYGLAVIMVLGAAALVLKIVFRLRRPFSLRSSCPPRPSRPALSGRMTRFRLASRKIVRTASSRTGWRSIEPYSRPGQLRKKQPRM